MTQSTEPAEGECLEALLDRTSELLSTLPRQQRRVAQLLLHSPTSFGFSSMRQLCGEVGVDAATVVRFARTLGFVGYQALQQSIRECYLDRLGLPREAPPAKEAQADDAALGARLAQQRRNLEGAHRVIVQSDLRAICDALIGAKRSLSLPPAVPRH